MGDTYDYRVKNGPGTMCGKYHVFRGRIEPKKDTVDCEHERFDRYHSYVCKYFDHTSKMCRYFRRGAK
jgi:hypothetical protein